MLLLRDLIVTLAPVAGHAHSRLAHRRTAPSQRGIAARSLRCAPASLRECGGCAEQRATMMRSFAYSSSSKVCPLYTLSLLCMLSPICLALLQRARSASSSSTDKSDDDGDDELGLGDDARARAEQARQRRGDDAASTMQSSVGAKMLMALGWTQGTGLGRERQGRTVPVEASEHGAYLGLGKLELDLRTLDAQRGHKRELQSERIARESDEQRRERQGKVLEDQAREHARLEAIREFRCELCDKAYGTVGHYDEHLNSYDHHHKARFRALQVEQRERSKASGDVARRREKERKREEREMRRQMGAAGVKLDSPLAAPVASKGWAKGGPPSTSTSAKGFKPVGVGGASAVPAPATEPPPPPPASSGAPQTGFKKAGWSSISKPSASSASSASPAAPPSAPPPPPPPPTSAAPAFTSGGFTRSTRAEDPQPQSTSTSSSFKKSAWQAVGPPQPQQRPSPAAAAAAAAATATAPPPPADLPPSPPPPAAASSRTNREVPLLPSAQRHSHHQYPAQSTATTTTTRGPYKEEGQQRRDDQRRRETGPPPPQPRREREREWEDERSQHANTWSRWHRGGR